MSVKGYQGNEKRMLNSIEKYYKKNISEFVELLYSKGNFDNTVNGHIKNLKVFYKWIETETKTPVLRYISHIQVPAEQIPILVLSKERLTFLLYNQSFHDRLCLRLQYAKDIFSLGCIIGLRVSDLLNLTKQNIERQGDKVYLRVRSQKTDIESRICLPEIAVEILERNYSRHSRKIFRPIGASNLNKYTKEIALLAGWTEEIPKYRKKRGRSILQYRDEAKKRHFRFCDLISTHTMRRTAITTMLDAGIKEEYVRQMSGHTPASKSFYRYVKHCQNTMDNDVISMHERLKKNANFD